MNRIAEARTYETSIEIIPERLVNDGFFFLHNDLENLVNSSRLPWISMPVKRGGIQTGLAVVDDLNIPTVPIRMSHTGPGNVYQPEAICVEKPSLEHILLPNMETANIAVMDGIRETVGTLIGVVATVNSLITEHNIETGDEYPFPLYHFFVLVDKAINGSQISNVHKAFNASPLIWYHGAGADDKSPSGKERGRNKTAIWGRLPDKFKGELPVEPYYTQAF